MYHLTSSLRSPLWLLLLFLLLVAFTQLPLTPATATPLPTDTPPPTATPSPIPPPGARIKNETQLCWDHNRDAPYFDVENRNSAMRASSGTHDSGVVCFEFASVSPGDELCVRVYNLHRSSPWDCQTVPDPITPLPTATAIPPTVTATPIPRLDTPKDITCVQRAVCFDGDPNAGDYSVVQAQGSDTSCPTSLSGASPPDLPDGGVDRVCRSLPEHLSCENVEFQVFAVSDDETRFRNSERSEPVTVTENCLATPTPMPTATPTPTLAPNVTPTPQPLNTPSGVTCKNYEVCHDTVPNAFGYYIIREIDLPSGNTLAWRGVYRSGVSASSDHRKCKPDVPVRYGERISVQAIADPEDDRYQDSDESESIIANEECSTRAECNPGYGDFLYQHEDLIVYKQGGEVKCARYEQTMCRKDDPKEINRILSSGINVGLSSLAIAGAKCSALAHPLLIGDCVLAVGVGMDTFVSPMVSQVVDDNFPQGDQDLYIPAGSYRQLFEVTCPTATPTPLPS